MKKKKYYPNNWQAYKDSDDSLFKDHNFNDFMNWKVAGWELPSSVCCIIRVTNKKSGKVKEHIYSRPYHAQNFIDKLLVQGHEFTIVDEASIHFAPMNVS